LGNETRSFAFRGKIVHAITCQNHVKELQVIRNLSGELLVAGRCEDYRSTFVVFGTEIIKEFGSIGKQSRVELDSLGNLPLQMCPSLEQPDRKRDEGESKSTTSGGKGTGKGTVRALAICCSRGGLEALLAFPRFSCMVVLQLAFLKARSRLGWERHEHAHPP